jgi:AraC-like DNA-binding protein
MDGLAGLLDGPRARSAFLLRLVLNPPWAIRIEDDAPLAVIAIVSGHMWITPDDGEPVRLDPGDVAIARGSQFYTIGDDPRTAPDVVIYPGQQCTSTADGRDLKEERDLGVRTWGDPDGETILINGTYEHAGEISTSLLAALPPLLVLRSSEWDSPLVSLLADEITKDHAGQRAVLDRLLDLLLVAILRTWFARQRDSAPAWYRAMADPVVGQALRLIHNAPAHPWTVAELAAESGASRAALARRFTELVGEPPMAYLTSWRLALAADLLCRPGLTIGAIARQVGYASPYALSTAFKRERGISPRDYRELTVTG